MLNTTEIPRAPTQSEIQSALAPSPPSEPQPLEAGHKYERRETPFEAAKAERDSVGVPPYAPFSSEDEWELAEFLVESGLSQNDISKFLKTKLYARCRATAPQDYATVRGRKSLLRTLDKLPGPRASWKVLEITVTGNRRDSRGRLMRQVLHGWVRNPVEVVADLIGNPEFKDNMHYAPVEEYTEDILTEFQKSTGPTERERILSDFMNTDWWLRVQRLVAERWPGATIAPVILCSDKTQLSVLSGDKLVWPVYLTIGNIDKDIRRKPSCRAVVLLGYLPVTKLHCFHEADRPMQGYRLFHFAMRQMLMPLVDAGKTGVMMTCADGYMRHVFPILAAYIADFPEQCLVCCTKENRCPTCLIERERRGELVNSCYRDPEATLAALRDPEPEQRSQEGLRDVPEPFWADLPYANIFNCIVPDLLHQLHKGVFMSHLVQWIAKGHEDELDARFARVPPYPGLRVFSQGITGISQWTGNEFRQMERIFVGIIDGLHADSRVVAAARAMLDFIYLAHYPSHTPSTLQQMRDALERFHANKDVFRDLNLREHFNIPKLHWLIHYISSIIDFGSCDGLSTEVPERLHIDFAKSAYRASNRKDYVKQMVTWLTRREKVHWFRMFLRWCKETRQDAAGVGDDDNNDDDNDNDNDGDDDEEDSKVADSESHSTRWDYVVLGADAHSLDSSLVDHDVEADETISPFWHLQSSEEDAQISTYATETLEGSADIGGTGGRDDWAELTQPESDMLIGPYQISRKPSLGTFSGDAIVHALGVVDFAPALAAFLAHDSLPGQSRLSEHSLLQHSYPVFKQFSRVLPSLRGYASEAFVDRVFARPAISGHPPRYSTVLYVEKPEIAETIGVRGYRVGHVRLIFSLPPALQRLRPHAANPFSHLAYLELYTPFAAKPAQPSGLYKVAKSYRGMKRRAVVVPVDRIFRSCHLLPVCDRAIDRSWSSETVLDECDIMYLNTFSDHHMYLFVE
ncbi:hypothetical protein BN946_scf184828.g7 [Trametes cinnabarina]|uniref:Uncharacterized protein n=1 Tax=Pycnoporus cinnabarinus TaxID=5643 RepID=A0A060SJI0_PYCCI|nr:hypothetical protein BN946_scf184828.g7 [Trametes cinnabarina]